MKKPETAAEAIAEIVSLPLIRLTVSNPRGSAEWKKIQGRPIDVRGESLIQLEKRTETQVFHENLAPDALEGRLCELMTCYGQLDATCQGAVFCLRISKKGKLLFTKQAAKTILPTAAAHNRQKQYLLAEGMIVPPLIDLGVLTADGRIVKAKYDKFKQINRFLEFLDDLLVKDTKEVVRIIDFGCGKSYLTFIVYYYITEILHRRAEITGLDLKEDVIRHCNEVAEKYGYEGLHFYCGDIRDYRTEEAPDMVITLHACDTATDHALFHAMEWGARYILSVPCCQHELNLSVRAGALPPVTGYGILKERFCAIATDAVRARLLESRGYEVQVMEFIDMSHSPKNLLIRARKSNVSREKRARSQAEAREIIGQLGGKSTLLELMELRPAFRPEGVIRHARMEDLGQLEEIYTRARQFMRDSGNPDQWGDGYPAAADIEADIRSGNAYVYEQDGQIEACFALIWGDDPTYKAIDGAWLNDAPYGTIHRIASRGNLPGAGLYCMDWALKLCGTIRIDTHKDNLPMQNALRKLGFRRCGVILCRDGTPREAFQRTL